MNTLALIESKSLRNEYLGKYTDDRALDVICKAKALIMSVWEGKNVATTKQIAEFFEVLEDVIRDNVRRHKDELVSDGLQSVGRKSSELCEIFSLNSEGGKVTLWTPRAALRLGMLLRDSAIAKQLRTLILDIVAIAPQQSNRIKELEMELAIATQNNQANQAALASRQLDHTMVTLHGKELVLALRGYSDQIVRVEEVVTEVVDVQKGSVQKILTADQLKAEIKRKTGQVLKSQAAFISELRKAGRDDLIIAVDRRVTGEYVIPDKLDEAISIVYKTKQQLIGQ